MIYLIDDNQHQQRQSIIGSSYLEDGEFDGYVSIIEKLEKKQSIETVDHLDFLREADCILLHSSIEDYDLEVGFVRGSRFNAIHIEEKIASYGNKIPLVLFSGSLTDSTSSIYIDDLNYLSLSKKTLYMRLYDFLQYFKEKGVVDIKILAGGKNYFANQFAKYTSAIVEVLRNKGIDENLKITDLSPVLSDAKSFFTHAFPNDSPNYFFDDLEDNPILVGEFLKIIKHINLSYAKFGKNIYPWRD